MIKLKIANRNIEYINTKEQKDIPGINKRKRFFGHTWLGWLNKIILQWLFIRLTEKLVTETSEHNRWLIMRWVIPTTGWGNDYKFVGGKPKE